MELILFVISALPVFLLAKSIYNQDKNKEPIKLLIKLFIAGIMSIFLVLIFSLVLGIIFPVLSAEYETLNKKSSKEQNSLELKMFMRILRH